MIPARKDVNAPIKEQNSEDQLAASTQALQTTVPTNVLPQEQRRTAFIANAVGTPTSVILSECGTDGGTLQYRRVSIGPQIQTSVQIQGIAGINSIPESPVAVNPRCTISSTQDLAHILVAATSNSPLHPVELQNSIVNVSASTPQQFQTLGNITNVNQRTTSTIVAQPQRLVFNSGGGMPDVYALRLAPSTIGGSANQQIMVLDSSARFSSSSDVTKVHSYSLASASPLMSPNTTVQKIVIGAQGQPVRPAVKRQLIATTRSNVLTVNSNELLSHLSTVNKLLFSLIPCEGKISTIPSSPKAKKIKLEKNVLIRDSSKRKKVVHHLSKKLKLLKIKYYQQQAEYFFLKNGGNLVDYILWRKKIPSALLEYLKANRFDHQDDIKIISDILSQSSLLPIASPKGLTSESSSVLKSYPNSSHPQSSSPSFRPTFSSAHRLTNPSSTLKTNPRQLFSSHKHFSKHNSISSVYDSQIGSQEEIVERAKQEAYVMQRVSDLRKEGLWSLKRLPKVADAPRIKVQYDYLLEEMVWLATDFAQERKWKKAAAKKCSRMITKYFQEKEIKAEKAEKEEQMRLRKIASNIAREIKQFWNNIEKLADFKQQTWLEEKRKKVLDTHLNFIVDQTEKYSSWLTQGMNQCSRTSSPLTHSGEFEPSASEEGEEEEEDDDETIQKEEEDVNLAEQSEEIKLLQQESQMTFEDFLDSLPPEMLNSNNSPEDGSDISKNEANSTEGLESDDDDDFCVFEEEDDDEQTILEQEKTEENVDHKKEIQDLEADNELPIEELKTRYFTAYGSNSEMDASEQISSENESEESPEEVSQSVAQTLLKERNSHTFSEAGRDSPSKEISDIAATAESFQPKGNTLSTTQVCTKVPFLLKHQLREYQHIGLDWMNAMYEKKLNGILADEMGLGKTIQTISVLAHLACEKGIWGPHLIVVPTSVMLNWEMELKKWCPAFKILTYYGTPKERKQKRVGWTKPNAFHICITSYKLVVQDHQSFRRKKWKYLILDEAQHIKNFKSQRWQMLLNFQSSHRLLLTGTPLQNNLMELWSLMHFLMPNVFQSHREFREWFVNPFTGMVEGSHEYNDSIVKRLHKVLRPFLLRRLKCEVEKQLPKKYEHVLMCRLSKRQRYLYDDFMSQTKTKETLASGNFMSVINILMQLRKVCNHPNMFEERPTVSPFLMEGVVYPTASLAYRALDYDPLKQVSLLSLNLLLADLELSLTAFAAHRVKKFQVPPKLIVEIDSLPEPPPACPAVKMKVNFCNSQASSSTPVLRSPVPAPRPTVGVPARPLGPQPQRYMVIPGQGPRAVNPVASSTQAEQYTLQLVQPGAALASLAPLGGLTLQLQPGLQANNRVQCVPSLIGGISRVVQTASGAHFVITSISNSVVAEQPTTTNAQSIVLAATGPRMVSPSTVSATSFLGRPSTVRTPSSLNGHPATVGEGIVNQNHVQPAKTSVVHALSKPIQKLDTNHGHAADRNSLFHLESLGHAKSRQRNESLRFLAKMNHCRSAACPIYGIDLVEAVTIMNSPCHPKVGSLWYGKGFVNAFNAITCRDDTRLFWDCTSVLSDMIKTPTQRVDQLTDVINRFVFVVPAVSAPQIEMHIPHPPPWRLNAERLRKERITGYLAPSCAFLHPILRNTKTQFPELRLIQYDCGKLQRLSHVLWELKSDHHRVLIFTQMTRMLDILEQFLNYHGHTYLRLDGNTKVEQRQALMERFNADKRIFCFILSTRSGGIGVNLTGADTVIFYDSDWNPTMDAQAQDRCHRIGQTRDVHIYRLISERTIEENILRKANQKRILGDLAIEGGNFTTAFFKTNTIHELFGFEARVDAKKHLEKRMNEDISEKPSLDPETFLKTQFEKALGMAEEESDLQAAQTASAEAVAELAEFDESIPLDNDSRDNEEKSTAEEEFDKLMEQLTPVERYALLFVESLQEPVSLEQLKLAEEEMEAQKKDWELGHLKALKEEEEWRSGCREDSPPLFCSRESSNQVFYSKVGHEEMPTWAPPTPPTNENDIYMDYQVTFWYDPSFMHEARLPPVFIKKEAKRQRMDPVISGATSIRKQKVRKDDTVNVPRSLFDRPSAAILKMRREVKLQKVKGLMVSGGIPKPLFPGIKPPALVVTKQPVDYSDKPEWVVQEDWAILQVIQDLQGIPLNLTVLLPAHTPNWDFASEVVFTVCRNYRSPKSCRLRYENIIVPREEGKILYDTNPKKQKKTKGIYKTKNNRPMKTSQLYVQDNNAAFNKIANERFKLMMENAMKRKAAERPTFSQTSKNVKIASVLAENCINYDVPLTPMQIATHRAERIAREKQKNQPSAIVLTPALAAAAAPAAQVAEQQQRTAAALPTNLISHQAVIASLAQAQQLQQVQLSKANLQAGTVASVSLTKSLTSGIMVSAGTAGTLAKALSTQGAAQNAAIAAALTNPNLRNQRATVTAVGTTTTLTVQEMVAAATSQIRAATASTGNIASTSAVVSVSNLAAVQLAASRLVGTTSSSSSATTLPSVAVNQLNTPVVTAQRGLASGGGIANLSQLQALRQNALLRQRETALKQQHLKRLQTIQQQQAGSAQPTSKVAIGTAAGTVTVATGQRAPQQVTVKQSVGRSMTEAEVSQIIKRQQQKQAVNLTASQILAQAQLQQVQPQQVSISGGTATLVKTVSAPSTLSIPVSAVNINVSVPQVKVDPSKGGGATITNQQLRQFQLQQQILNQARKGSKMTASLTQLAKVTSKGSSSTTPISTVQIVPQMSSTTQQVKGLPTAMTVQQIQQAMKQAIPQNLPVVVTATPSLSSIQQHTSMALRGEPGVVSSVKTATLPSTTLTTSGVLKAATSAVVVGQHQTTAALLQQVAAAAASSTGGGINPQAVTLAVRATQSQQQVQIQVQPTPSSLLAPQVAALQSQVRQQAIAVQNTAASNLLPAATVQQVDSATHLVMHAPCTSAPTLNVTAPTNAQVVQQAIQLARQQQQAAAAAQQQKASPYTMRLRNPPK